jgi:hypothetical protein
MKNVLSTKNPRSQAFQRYREHEVFLNFCYRSAAGAPRQWGQNASYLIEKGVTLSDSIGIIPLSAKIRGIEKMHYY